jgi:hypothetical protein
MTILAEPLGYWEFVLLWGLVATVVMTTIIYGSQGLGLSRLSLSFLAGTFFTGNRGWANVVGFIVYMLGGWMFAYIYVLILLNIGLPGIWMGSVIGFVHGLFLLTVILPLLPYIHPRMATEYDGPTHLRRLEPPGFMGLNYGFRTPLTTLLAQTLYGTIVGLCYQIS